MKPQRISIIGSGNVATHLATNLASAHTIVEVYSHSLENAKLLADKVRCKYTADIEHLDSSADIYIFSVKDSVLESLLTKVTLQGKVIVHTAGSLPLDILASSSDKYGVIYPLQSISKNVSINFSEVPLFIEGSSAETTQLLLSVAQSISQKVYEADTTFRGKIHLAAVFACNFANDLYAIAAEILESGGIPFDVLLPLIDETTRKVHTTQPRLAQTGPAIRYDKNIINKHISMLSDERLKQIYQLITEDIHTRANKSKK